MRTEARGRAADAERRQEVQSPARDAAVAAQAEAEAHAARAEQEREDMAKGLAAASEARIRAEQASKEALARAKASDTARAQHEQRAHDAVERALDAEAVAALAEAAAQLAAERVHSSEQLLATARETMQAQRARAEAGEAARTDAERPGARPRRGGRMQSGAPMSPGGRTSGTGAGPRRRATNVSAEETSTQVQVIFTRALESEGMWVAVDAAADGLVDPSVDHPRLPVLLAISDNGPQMTSGSTRAFMAVCAIAQHFGRPGTPKDQAWIESFFGHLKFDYPHLDRIGDPAVLRAELDFARFEYNEVRLHAGIGYVTPDDEHEGRGPAIRKARRDGLEAARQERIAYHRQHQVEQPPGSPDVD